MPIFLSVLMAVQGLTYREAPAGAVMHVRLTNAVGSFASKRGDIVNGVLIAPVKVEGDTVLPSGTVVRGTVKSVRRVGLGILRETASLDITFDSIVLPGGTTLPVWAKLASVDNGREEVMPSGEIRMGRSTESWGNRAAHYVRAAMMLNVHTQLASWVVKSIVTQVPEPEIYLPSGAELTLVLTQPVRALSVPDPIDDSRGFTEDQRVSLEPVIADLPDRAYAKKKKHEENARPSDIVNILLIGSREQISAAFTAAGWSEARRNTTRNDLGSAFAMIFRTSYHNAPMSSLRINDAEPDMSWEKGFNDITKRHHVRLWKMEQTWDGKELWAATATRDVDIGFLRSGRWATHRVEEHVDHERDKIAWDLTYSACSDAMDWWDRPAIPNDTHNATGDRMLTDGQLVVLQVNDCAHPRGVASPAQDRLPMHGRLFQRIVRREILSARSDLIRDNIYWKVWEGSRMLITAIQAHRGATPEPDAAPKKTFASKLQPGGLTSIVSFR